MDEILRAIAAVVCALTQRRFLLCAGLAIALAVALAHALAWFSGAHGLALVLVGVGFGVLWQGRAEAGIPLLAMVESPPISKPVAFLVFALNGVVLGAWLAYSFGSPLAAALVMGAAPFIVGGLRAVVLQQGPALGYPAFVSASLLAGFAAGLGLSALNA